MYLLTSVSDLMQVVTSAVGQVEVHASYVDNASGTITPGRTNTADITTATTTTVVAAPGASTQRNVKTLNVRNNHATVTNLVTVLHTDGTNSHGIVQAQLLPGESLVLDENGDWSVYTAAGVIKAAGTVMAYNSSTANQTGFAADTYLTGSSILIPAQRPKIGTRFRAKFDMAKTAAGTAPPIVTLRYGNAASTADTALLTFTFSAGTAATDTGVFEIEAVYRSVGSGTAAVLAGRCRLNSQPTTGLSSLLKAVAATSAGHDSTTSSYLGVSFNGGASFSGTNVMVSAEMENI